MDKTLPKPLLSLALMKTLWAKSTDIIENYVPFVVKFIIETECKTISPNALMNHLKSEYGLDNITYAAVITILKRMQKQHRLLNVKGDIYYVHMSEVQSYNKNLPDVEDIEENFYRIKNNLKNYALQNHKLNWSDEETNDYLSSFFSKHNFRLALEDENLDENLNSKYNPSTASQKARYVVSLFVLDLKKNNPSDFKCLADFALGNMIASLITLKDFAEKGSKLNNLTIYVDCPIVIKLLGICDSEIKEHIQATIKRLIEVGAKVVISKTHYDEVINSIEYAINFLQTEFQDQEKISRIASFVQEKGWDVEKLISIKTNVSRELQRHGIAIVYQSPVRPDNYTDIDKSYLKSNITKIYTQDGAHQLPNHKLKGIDRDANVIVDIFRIRGNNSHSSLKNCRAILLTNNIALCKATSDDALSQYSKPLSGCITDYVLSTLLWLSHPQKCENINEKLLISVCQQNILTDTSLVRKFIHELKAAHKEHTITDETFLEIIQTKELPAILKEMTFNCMSLYSDSTFAEIKRRVEQELEEKRQEELSNKKEQVLKHYKIAKFCACGCIALTAIILIIFICIDIKPIFSIIVGIFDVLLWSIPYLERQFLYTKILLSVYNKLSSNNMKFNSIKEIKEFLDSY